MDAAVSLVKPQVRRMAAYTLHPYEPTIKLNQNESPYDVPAELKRRLQERLAARPWNRYPPFVAHDFISAVSEATGWGEDGILVANGSNELIQAVLAVVVGPGVGVVIPEPTFTLYRLLTEVNGGDPIAVPLTPELRFDVDAIVAAAADASVVVLCTPNNPTGSALAREEIERVHDETRALVVLDQAYVEFGGYDAVELLADRPRLIVLRTFSKAVALAGLRAGYLLGHPALVEQVNKGKLPYNINFFTEAVAAEVLRHRELFRPQVREIRAGRDLLYRELSAMPGIHAYPSEANFVLFRVEVEGLSHRAVFDRLLGEYGVLVRDVSKYPMLAGCLRVNAGTPQENDAFLTALREILQEAPR